LFKVVGDGLAFVQASQACAFDGRDVHENIAPAVIGLDEAETLLRIEPLYDAGDGTSDSLTIALPR